MRRKRNTITLTVRQIKNIYREVILEYRSGAVNYTECRCRFCGCEWTEAEDTDTWSGYAENWLSNGEPHLADCPLLKISAK